MGWFREKREASAEAAKEKASGAVETSKDALYNLYRKTKNIPRRTFDKAINSKLKKGKCAGCSRPIASNGYYHKKCAKAALAMVDKTFPSADEINRTNHCPVCYTNFLTTYEWELNPCCKA